MTKEKETVAVIAYKGFDGALQCRGMQYVVGETYTHEGEVKVCSSGFHACEYPLDIFNYYPPAGSRFALVEQGGTLSKHADDSKVASSTIKISAEINLSGLIKAAVEYTFSRSKPENGATGPRGAASATGYQGAASATGDQGAASATGYRGAASATGYRGAASATGDQGAASATGDQGAASATGYRGAASATGPQGKVTGKNGNALFLVERDRYGNIIAVWAGIVGREGVKPDTWYTLVKGEAMEVTA